MNWNANTLNVEGDYWKAAAVSNRIELEEIFLLSWSVCSSTQLMGSFILYLIDSRSCIRFTDDLNGWDDMVIAELISYICASRDLATKFMHQSYLILYKSQILILHRKILTRSVIDGYFDFVNESVNSIV